jgi:hypothetical protein
MDGLKIPIQRSRDALTQNAYYNGWLPAHFVGWVMAFAPYGIIVACKLNAPGSWHDSFIAQNGGLYDQLRAVFDSTGGKRVVDSVFSKKHCPFLIKSGNCKPGETPLQTMIHRQATSFRQSAEWGMRAVEGSFPWLNDKLLLLETIDCRKVFLHTITMLHNFCTHQATKFYLLSCF